MAGGAEGGAEAEHHNQESAVSEQQASQPAAAAAWEERKIAECVNCEVMKELLVEFYEEEDPDKAGNIGRIAVVFAPTELEGKLFTKYGNAPDLSGLLAIAEQEGAEGMKASLMAFYEREDPAKVDNVEKISWKFCPHELARALTMKYGSSPAFFAGDDVDIKTLKPEEVPKRTGVRISGGWQSHSKSKHLKKNLGNLKKARASANHEMMI